jgi:hypothetical protein
LLQNSKLRAIISHVAHQKSTMNTVFTTAGEVGVMIPELNPNITLSGMQLQR